MPRAKKATTPVAAPDTELVATESSEATIGFIDDDYDLPPASVPGETVIDFTPETGIDPQIEVYQLRIVELETTVTQLVAENNALRKGNAKLIADPLIETGAVARVVGVDWRNRTVAEAQAEGVKVTTLCKDGYYVPG